MKAVAYRNCLPVTDPQCLIDFELPEPVAGGRDILVRVKAVSVGSQVTLFRPGDEVWYAGSRARSGTNAELHLVDERIVGSIAIQLARRLTGAQIVATASRPESRAQAERLGAHVVLDHRQPLSTGMQRAGLRWAGRVGIDARPRSARSCRRDRIRSSDVRRG
jgi:NADPH:quinone reductase-like Zn-dependent oxidoreductase